MPLTAALRLEADVGQTTSPAKLLDAGIRIRANAATRYGTELRGARLGDAGILSALLGTVELLGGVKSFFAQHNSSRFRPEKFHKGLRYLPMH